MSTTSDHADKPYFLQFKVKMAKTTLKVKVNDPYYQYQPRISQDACLVLLWWIPAQICDEKNKQKKNN